MGGEEGLASAVSLKIEVQRLADKSAIEGGIPVGVGQSENEDSPLQC